VKAVATVAVLLFGLWVGGEAAAGAPTTSGTAPGSATVPAGEEGQLLEADDDFEPTDAPSLLVYGLAVSVCAASIGAVLLVRSRRRVIRS
jgi:hypothetical protein